MAIEVGLTPIQFWYGDLYLLDVYVEAYNKKTENNAILNGLYVNVAIMTAMSACFGKSENANYVQKVQEMKAEQSGKNEKESQTESFNNKVNFWSTFKSRMGK